MLIDHSSRFHVSVSGFEETYLGAPAMRLTSAIHGDGQPIESILGALDRNSVSLIAARVPSNDDSAVRRLVSVGFYQVENLIRLSRALDAPTDPPKCDVAKPSDADACAEIARHAFKYDRFHTDQSITNATADSIKADWCRNNVLGRADVTYVTRSSDGTVTGFNSVLVGKDDAVIDLIAVAETYRGKGCGRCLVDAALTGTAASCKRLIVSTQENNRGSLALYVSMGFAAEQTFSTFHWRP